MRKTTVVVVLVCLVISTLVVVGCGSSEVQYISPSGKTYTPEQFKSELQTLYDGVKGAKAKFEKDGSGDYEVYKVNQEIMANKIEALETFMPGCAGVIYDSTGQAVGFSESAENLIETYLSLDDEKLEKAIENQNGMNEKFEEL